MNEQESADTMNSLSKDLHTKESLIKEKSQEINKLQFTIEKLEEKLKFFEMDKESQQERFSISEKKYKEDIINFRQLLSQKDQDLQTLSNEKESIRFENEKLKQELRKLEECKSNDEFFFNQIQDMQSKFAEKEKSLQEEKENIIKSLKKEIENLNSQIKKSNLNNEKELKILQTENLSLKQEINYLREESSSHRDTKDKIIKLEKSISEFQNGLALKKVELTQTQMECEKYREELNKLEIKLKSENKDLSETIGILQDELVVTKQKLGDCLNELSECESKLSNSYRGEEKGKFSFFGKKKKKEGEK
jgi:chromosome segregation ATPase